jgi:DNA-binding NtrC family response regulator
MAVILIVEDDTSIRELVELILEDGGYDTLSASDVEEAAQLLTSPRPIDALFTDIDLKTAPLGGCELAKLAVVCRPGMPVLYTSGKFTTDKLKAHFPRKSLFLRKPYTENDLLVSVEVSLRS